MSRTGAAGADDAAGRLRLPGTENVRDLGGIPAATGTVVAAGLLLRGEALSADAGPGLSCYDPAHAAEFRALGLAVVLDLRQPEETTAVASAWATATGAEMVPVPFGDGADGVGTSLMARLGSGELREFSAGDMTALYLDWMTRQPQAVARVVRLLASPGRLPALVYCAAGKDRTGIVIAVVLTVLGVSRDRVVADYALTQVLRPGRAELADRWLTGLGTRVDDVRVLFESPAEVMADTLAQIDARWGSVDRYLHAAGVTEGELDALRTALLAPDPLRPAGQ